MKNNTEYPVKIVATVNGRQLTCNLLGVAVPGQRVELSHSTVSTSEPKLERTANPEIPQGYKHVIKKGAPGYTIASNRIVKVNGEVVQNEKLPRSVYRAAPIEEEVNPADMNTPSENLKYYTPGMNFSTTEPAPKVSAPTSETDKTPSSEVTAPHSPSTEKLPTVTEPQPDAQPDTTKAVTPTEPETVVIPDEGSEL